MRKTHRRRAPLFVGIAVAALVAAFGVSPATAGAPTQAAWSCDESVFNSLAAFAPAANARGDVAREPGLVQEHVEATRSVRNRSQFRVTVPTWVHVVSDGAIGNVSNAAINDQIQVLNRTFAGQEGGYRTGFSFQLVGITRTNNAQWHYANPGGAERHMKRTLHRGGDDTLNIYLTTAGAYLGWAYLPSVTDQGNSYLDGIVVDWESMLGTSTRYAGQYDKGETATHEVGHWLNLEHTFFHGCNGEGDFVDDTPYMSVPTNGCPAGKDTCPQPGVDPIHNYMDYSYDQCYTEFTAGQAARMQDAWATWRAS